MKNKKVIIVLMVIVLIVAGGFGYSYMTSPTLHALEDTVYVEYGQNVSIEMEDYLDLSKISNSELAQMEDQCVISHNMSSTEKPDTGVYSMFFAYDSELLVVTVVVSDTQAPTFTSSIEHIELTQDCDVSEDVLGQFECEDENDVIISIDDSGVDYGSIGDYEAKIIATDLAGNYSSLDITITILEPILSIEYTGEQMYVGDTFTFEPVVTGSDTTPSYTSSDESIATVDENGEVTAVSQGTVTISASANGVEATCSIDIKALEESPDEQNYTSDSSGSSSGSSSSGSSSSGSSSSGSSSSGSSSSGSSSSGSSSSGSSSSGSSSSGSSSSGSSSSGSSSSGSSSSGSSSSGGTTDTTGVVISSEALTLINEARAEQGLSALTYKASLGEAVKIRAKEASVKWSHTRPNGSAPSTVYPLVNSGSYFGECLAKGQTTPSYAVLAWSYSTDHWTTLMGSQYTYCAVAYYVDASGVYYWCALVSNY